MEGGKSLNVKNVGVYNFNLMLKRLQSDARFIQTFKKKKVFVKGFFGRTF